MVRLQEALPIHMCHSVDREFALMANHALTKTPKELVPPTPDKVATAHSEVKVCELMVKIRTTCTTNTLQTP